ncbi:DNA-binding protein [bacterium]|nr:DNA-binding protein [bacterium]
MITKKSNEKYVLVLEKGEKLLETITAFAKENELKGAFLSGIGALEDVELGYYNLHTKEYQRKMFDGGDYELLAVNANLSLKNGEPYVHAHASIAGEDFKVYGGHLFEATVAVTAEIFCAPFGAMPVREHDEKIGLDLICKFV